MYIGGLRFSGRGVAVSHQHIVHLYVYGIFLSRPQGGPSVPSG